jgi:hypothetical protein
LGGRSRRAGGVSANALRVERDSGIKQPVGRVIRFGPGRRDRRDLLPLSELCRTPVQSKSAMARHCL